MPTTVDFVSTFGAPTDGVSDCGAALDSLNIYMTTHNDVILTVPAHTYVLYSSRYVAESPGNSKLVIQGTGAVFTTSGSTSWFLGGHGEAGVAGFSARIASVNVGSTTLTLLNVGDASLFTVGRYVRVGNIDLQAAGAPPNNHVIEYAKVTNISGTTITLSAPLINSYFSTYPLYFAGNTLIPDQGGPATIWAMPASWDVDVEYVGVTLTHPLDAQWQGKCRRIKFTNVTCTNSAGIAPTENKECIFEGCNFSACNMEFDKSIETLTINNTPIGGSFFQSSSVQNLISTGGLITSFNGTPKNVTITGATIGSLIIGPIAYGIAESFNISNSTITSISTSLGAHTDDILNNGFVCSNGIMSVLGGPVTWGIPRACAMFRSTKDSETSFRINTISTDSGYSRFATTLSDGFPNVPISNNRLDLGSIPVLQAQFTNCTGCPAAIDLSQVGAQCKPLWSYSKRIYSGDASGTILKLSTAPPVTCWGRLISININVSQKYTGIQSSLLANIFNPLRQLNGDNTVSTWDPVIDLKTIGLRTITPISVTGVVGSDSISVPGKLWFSSDQQLTVNHDVSSEASGLWPIVEIEVITDQGAFGTLIPFLLRAHR